MDGFLNELDANLLIALAVFVATGSPVFGIFYNQAIDKLKGEYEHLSLYVAIGVSVTLVFVSLLSWKAALLTLIVFCLTGLPMIFGEFRRTEKRRKTVRRKRLPYAANGLIDDAKMATIRAHEKMTRASATNSLEEIYKLQRDAALELITITEKLSEVRRIQMEK